MGNEWRTRWLLIGAALVSTSFAADAPPLDPSSYAAESLTLADRLVPKLSASLRACDVAGARAVHEEVNAFLYKQWDWHANYERLKSYRPCYQMLSDIAATTQIVTNSQLAARPNHVAGLFDSNYASCGKLKDPSLPLPKGHGAMKWPQRFGAEPSRGQCR